MERGEMTDHILGSQGTSIVQSLDIWDTDRQEGRFSHSSVHSMVTPFAKYGDAVRDALLGCGRGMEIVVGIWGEGKRPMLPRGCGSSSKP